ncbi:MAG: DnaB-like helicase N-terminal domain-containing protein [Alphaproteobacteria bacterium]
MTARIESITRVPELPYPLPVEEDIEAAVLGVLLADNRHLFSMPQLSAADFHLRPHRLVFAAVQKLIGDGTTASALTLRSHFEATGELVDVGGPMYLARLAAGAHDPRELEEWAEILRDRALRRRGMLHAFETMTHLASTVLDSHALEIVGDAMAELAELSAETGSRRVNVHDLRIEIAESLHTRPVVYGTGLARLDRAMGGGLYPGRAYGIAGRNKSGKTALADTISFNLNHAGARHLYVAAEMNAREIEHRQMARALGRNALDFLDQRVRRDVSFQRDVADLAVRTPANVLYRDLPGGTFDELRREVEQAAMADGIAGFVLDYLQLVRGKPKGVSTAEHLDNVSQWIADVCKRRSLWALVLAQLNQEGNTRGGEGPLMAFDQVYRLDRPTDASARGEVVPASTSDNAAWLTMLSTRYTRWGSVGVPASPALRLNETVGPFFEEIEDDR